MKSFMEHYNEGMYLLENKKFAKGLKHLDSAIQFPQSGGDLGELICRFEAYQLLIEYYYHYPDMDKARSYVNHLNAFIDEQANISDDNNFRELSKEFLPDVLDIIQELSEPK